MVTVIVQFHNPKIHLVWNPQVVLFTIYDPHLVRIHLVRKIFCTIFRTKWGFTVVHYVSKISSTSVLYIMQNQMSWCYVGNQNATSICLWCTFLRTHPSSFNLYGWSGTHYCYYTYKVCFYFEDGKPNILVLAALLNIFP